MNKLLLVPEVQDFINKNLHLDARKIALQKSPFNDISSADLAGQIISKKKSKTKLPTWFNCEDIYYPPTLSIEQCSSEPTAMYKSKLSTGLSLVDLTAGFGVDSFFFAKTNQKVFSCEINLELSEISSHNAKVLDADNIVCLAVDGIEWLKQQKETFGTIYLDPARRLGSSKVFRLPDCTPNVIDNLPLLLSRANRILIKTAPLLDINAGISDLKNIKEIHIVSVKNECKEIVWLLEPCFDGPIKMTCATLNEKEKTLNFSEEVLKEKPNHFATQTHEYLYEPDVALLKSGAFSFIGNHFGLSKLQLHSHLYQSNSFLPEFPGRIFKIQSTYRLNDLKKQKSLQGNVIVRNFPEKAENLGKKYKIKPDLERFIIFTQDSNGYLAIDAKILQHY